MKRICLIGGKLQGFEAAYHAKKASMGVALVDRNENAFIKDLVDEFHCFDVTEEPEKLIEISATVDAMLPVNENFGTIDFLETIKDRLHCPLLFDFDAYRISRDKSTSKKYFRSIGIPTPTDRPSHPPYFIKPSCMSSSIGTAIIYDDEGLKGLDPTMLIEEYVEGDVLSLEVVGDGEHFAVVKETKVHIDDTYDCHMVTPIDHNPELRRITYELARNLKLKGIMDVEAIDSPQGLKVLEIDARFPSQTPTAVYHSSGVNLLELLFKAFTEGVQEMPQASVFNYCVYEHLILRDGQLSPIGEHILSMGKNYRPIHGSEGIEIFQRDGEHKAFTVITWGKDQEKAEMNRKKAHEMILGIPKKEVE
ncbi:MAG: 3-methylornithine--L-lysine ligase PylC [Methanomethylovorans sp.]|nr:3-methylornithine--L-lysine ligase PylC [Methanomethylovorans sp.]